MRWTVVLAALVLTGCGSVKVSERELPEGTYRLEYQPGGVEARAPVMNALETKADEVCPAGWNKVRQGKTGDRVYEVFWVVRCAGGERCSPAEASGPQWPGNGRHGTF